MLFAHRLCLRSAIYLFDPYWPLSKALCYYAIVNSKQYIERYYDISVACTIMRCDRADLWCSNMADPQTAWSFHR